MSKTFSATTGWQNNRRVTCDGTAYANGTIACTMTNESTDIMWGCRGGALLVGVGPDGTALWSRDVKGDT
jgi:hypothetical protein